VAASAFAGLTLCLMARPAHAQARTPETVLMSESPAGREFQERYGYADAVIAGDLVFLSGVVVGPAPGETSMVPGFDRAFRHIGTVLARAGSGYDGIVEITSYHTDVTAQLEPMAEAKARYLKGPPPAWTAIDVDRLLPDGGIAEIKIVARRTRPAPGAGDE
jgi:enamine deaminase RidA (YjgF/YER057c/UK114 family)